MRYNAVPMERNKFIDSLSQCVSKKSFHVVLLQGPYVSYFHFVNTLCNSRSKSILKFPFSIIRQFKGKAHD